MKIKNSIHLFLLLLIAACSENKHVVETPLAVVDSTSAQPVIIELPEKNKLIIEATKKFGPGISPTYEKAVCTELVIQVLEKVQSLDANDKSRIRIITNENIHQLLDQNSNIPKGVYYSLLAKERGIPIENIKDVLEGDLVQFWTESWGHCGIVKSVNPDKNEMELYSSFPSTNGYGIQKFSIPKHSFFVRLQ